MNWVRLLAAGKSLVGLRDGHSRYRVAPEGGLPKFDSPRNPFRATAMPSGKSARMTVAEAASAEPGKPGKLQKIASKLFASRKSGSGMLPLPVQEELALDRVKVVRNDWTDADVAPPGAKPQSVELPAQSVLKQAGEPLAETRTANT